MMKKTLLLLSLFIIAGAKFAFAGFDYSTLKNKVLYIPRYNVNDDLVKRLLKRGKDNKAQQVINDAESYNKAWEDAMASSSYDATPYEIKAVNAKDLVKNKNSKALVLVYLSDENSNEYVYIMNTGPKRAYIAKACVNRLDFNNASDLRLIINMLNQDLNQNIELFEEKSKVQLSAKRNKYKATFVAFMDAIADKTFLVPEVQKKNEDKAAKETEELKKSFEDYWTMSKYEFTTEEEVEKRRQEGDPQSFYWRRIPIFTQNPLITYNLNLILSSEKDEVLFAFLGSRTFKEKTMEEMQTKMIRRAERYKKSLQE